MYYLDGYQTAVVIVIVVISSVTLAATYYKTDDGKITTLAKMCAVEAIGTTLFMTSWFIAGKVYA